MKSPLSAAQPSRRPSLSYFFTWAALTHLAFLRTPQSSHTPSVLMPLRRLFLRCYALCSYTATPSLLRCLRPLFLRCDAFLTSSCSATLSLRRYALWPVSCSTRKWWTFHPLRPPTLDHHHPIVLLPLEPKTYSTGAHTHSVRVLPLHTIFTPSINNTKIQQAVSHRTPSTPSQRPSQLSRQQPPWPLSQSHPQPPRLT